MRVNRFPQHAMRYLVRHVSAVQASLDSLVWAAALVAATALRYDFHLSHAPIVGFILLTPLAMLCQLVAGLLDGLYMGRSRYGTFEEVAGMVRSVLLTGVLVFGLNAWLFGSVVLPRGAVVIASVLAVLGMGALRYAWRLLLESRRRTDNQAAERVVIFGAGEGAAQAIAAMRRDPDGCYLPVALLDDNPAKRNLRIMGVPVVGSRQGLATTAERYRSSTMLIAIPSAEGRLIREMKTAGEALGLTVLVLPPVKELFGSPVALSDLREVNEADLLGRHRIETDLDAIAGYLAGRRVLVTGAGGSIGSELCRQLHRFNPAELMMLDRDESALHGVQLSIEGQALLDSPDLILVDIRDRDRVEQVFRDRRPEVVFHAAALKHLTLLERNPSEAIKTNVFGSLHLLQIAAEFGVARFVNISTDKAADPISVLGHSKRVVERLTSWYAQDHRRAYLSVRFGNVLGSRGSVLGAFQAQVAKGGPVTVTSPEVTRFFMTVEEAVQLVIQAGAIGKPGEVLVLDMG
ncbi:MAG: SDR family NAD(P)-dependent oxidoreductase, partial [Actinomycetota bacterium]|nr:SDR family NAD(P)-dependent oxidoreductase [Actinomycetota bacterium]